MILHYQVHAHSQYKINNNNKTNARYISNFTIRKTDTGKIELYYGKFHFDIHYACKIYL